MRSIKKYFLENFFLFGIIFVFTLSSCSKDNCTTIDSNIANEKVSLHNLEELTEKMANSPELANEDAELFVNAITRVGSEKDSLVGKTILEIINNQKKFVRERTNEILRNSGARISLFLNHKFEYIGIQFEDDDSKNKINNIVFEVKNTSDKNIKKLEGRLQFYTPNGEIIKLYNLVTATEIPSNSDKATKFVMPFRHDETSNRDQIIRNSRNLNAIWTPTSIEFTDGTKIIDKATSNDKLSQ